MNIQPYTADDYDSLIGLYKNHYAYGGHFDPHRDTTERLDATGKEGNLYVAHDNGKVVGSFMILENPHTFWVIRFVVDPRLPSEHEVVAALFENARTIARERGHESIMVYTDSNDPTLNQRYTDLGCHQADDYRCYWKETK